MLTQVIAHRGLYHRDYCENGSVATPSLYRENSVPALLVAAVRGFPVELDVRASVDGQAIVSHDDTVNTRDGSALVISDSKIAALRSAGVLGTDGVTVPMLADVLDALSWRTHLHIELKSMSSALAAFQALRTAGAGDDELTNKVTVSSFSLTALDRFRAKCPETPLAWLRTSERVVEPDEIATAIKEHFIGSVHLRVEDFSEELAAWYAELGVSVRLFTVNEPIIAINVAATGFVNGIFTDHAGEITSALQA